jgi:diguanylate cyclase (GGDEF)-like protein
MDAGAAGAKRGVLAAFRRGGSAVAAYCRRDTPLVALAVLYLIFALVILLTRVVPHAMNSRAGIAQAFSIAAIIGAGLLVALAGRWAATVYIAAAFGMGLVGLQVAVAPTSSALTASTVAFVWMAMYIAYFFEGWAARIYLVAMVATINVALAFATIALPISACIRITVSVLGVGVVLHIVMTRLRNLANTDRLTRLLNRNGLERLAGRLIPTCQRKGVPIALCMVDLDAFKEVNDTVGHVGADRLLVDLATSWRSRLGRRDLIARYGGDEFLVLLPGMDVAAAEAVMEELRSSSPLEWSAGVVAIERGETLDEAHERVDRELYRDKARRRGTQPDMAVLRDRTSAR